MIGPGGSGRDSAGETMTMKTTLGAAAFALGLGLATPILACELDRPLKIAGLDYDSAAFHTAVASAIALGSFGSDACASANHASNRAKGSSAMRVP